MSRDAERSRRESPTISRGMRHAPARRRTPPGSARRALRGLVAAVAVLVAGTACTPLDDAMVAIFGRSMRDQRSFDPYENPRLPAENSVPFASGNYPAQIWDVGLGQAEEGADMAPFAAPDMAPPGSDRVRTLENPVPATEESLARGQVMFERYCAVCHGARGMSADAPILEKLPVMGAWNLAIGNPTGYTDGYIYGMIRQGRGAMPSYGHRVTHFDRWHIVNYVRQLQQESAGGASEDAPSGDAADPDTTGDGAAADTTGGGS